MNHEWVFSGIGVTVVFGAIGLLFKTWRNARQASESGVINITNVNNVSGPAGSEEKSSPHAEVSFVRAVDDKKSRIRILFIDDDTRFQVVRIIKDHGWVHTKIIRDIKSLASPDVEEADIFFVDIQGVGKLLNFANEGLGLALAIKNKYPKKKVVIYSAQTSGDRFNEALRKADDFLAKNAEPYEFITVVERLAEDL
jgi:hypothetical protein